MLNNNAQQGAASVEANRSEDFFSGGGEMGARMRAVDWARTPLGPPAQWPRSLKTVVRIALDSRYAMWFGWGPDLTFFCNDAYSPTLGIKKDWAIGASARTVWKEIWPDVGPRIDSVLATATATWDEGLLLFLERSGVREETYHTFSYSPLPDDTGAVQGLLCVVTEETERVIGERRIVLLRDLASELASVNQEADVMAAIERCLGREARDLPFSLTFLAGADGELHLAASTGFAPSGRMRHADPELWAAEAVLASGETHRVTDLAQRLGTVPTGPWDRPPQHALALPIVAPGQSRPAGVFVCGLNPNRPVDAALEGFLKLLVGQISAGLASTRAYESERRRAENLAALDRAKTTFFSNISHELRTPLTLMLGPIEAALESDGGTLHGPELGLAHRNALRLLKLVNSLLDFARIEAGRAHAQFEPVALGEFTAELASVFRSAIERAGMTLSIECAALPGTVPVDREMWEKIVLNLLSNAFKYTLEGSIGVSLREEDGQAVLRVTDTGTGIPAAELPRLFERFHRVEGARGRTHEGTGIGLALVKELVGLHGGTIAIASDEGRGTTVTVTLPLRATTAPQASAGVPLPPAVRAAPGARAFVEEALRWLPDAPASAAAPDDEARSARGRILVADDNADLRAYLVRLLSERWAVSAVGDGAAALAWAREHRPDVIVCDVMMPALDGFGLLRAMQDDPALAQTPVILVSARAGEEARLDGLRSGAADYVVKPFSARDLCGRIEAQLLRSRIRNVEMQQSQRMARVFENVPVGIALFRGPEHVFEFANAPYHAIVGRRDIVGKPVREALPELAQQGIYEIMDRVYATREPFVGRSWRVLLDRGAGGARQEGFFDFVFQVVPDGAGNSEALVIVVFEVTELANARRDAESASRAKDSFLAMLGHELRNPLAPIVTALQLMQLRGAGPSENERVVIDRQVTHVVGLVDDLLDVSRVIEGKLTLKKQAVPLSEIVSKGIEQASPLLDQRHHKLRVHLPEGNVQLFGDPRRLAQVIANLMTNAAKYTEPEGVISLSATVDGGDLEIDVEDNGIGMSPETLRQVFDQFFQVQQESDRAQGGLGLGLAIVKSLVTLHGGTVSASSPGLNKGSRFTVRLPLPHTQAAAAAPGAPARAAPPPGIGRRILIVDDNRDAADSLAEFLSFVGNETAVAYNGPSALQVAGTFTPDVVLLDIGLPVMDGYQLAENLRSLPGLESVTLIAVTGYGQESDQRRSREAGFSGHLVKPVQMARLEELLRAAD